MILSAVVRQTTGKLGDRTVKFSTQDLSRPARIPELHLLVGGEANDSNSSAKRGYLCPSLRKLQGSKPSLVLQQPGPKQRLGLKKQGRNSSSKRRLTCQNQKGATTTHYESG